MADATQAQTTATETAMMTIADFVRLYDEEGPFELVDGERITLSPTSLGHNRIAAKLLIALSTYATANDLGEAMIEPPFIIGDTGDADWVAGSRVPDVMFVTAARWTAYQTATPDWRDRPLGIVPDLAVEIVSPNDRYTEIDTKVTGYLGDGIQLVWVINPRQRSVTIHKSGSKQQLTLSGDDMLTGGDMMPDFTIGVADLFE